MKRSRVIVGLAVFVATATPLLLLSCVTDGVRYGILTKIYDDADIVFPSLARALWIFGPLDWWSYITPIALAVGIAARIRVSLSSSFLSAVVAFSVIQSLVIYGAFQPFVKLGSAMGYPLPAPYPTLPLIVNAAMVIGALLFAATSIRRNIRGGFPGQQIIRAKSRAASGDNAPI